MNPLLTFILVAVVGMSTAFPSASISSEELPEGRFVDSLITSNMEGVLKDFEDGKYKMSFQIKKKDGYHDFCLRIHVDSLGSVTKFMYGKEKVIKPCIGVSRKTLEDNSGLVKYRIRVGSNELYTDEIPVEKKMSSCKDIFILGTMCIKDFTYKSAKLMKSKSTRNTICFTVILKDQKIKYDICGTFDGFELKDWKCDKGQYSPEEIEGIPTA